MSGWSTQHRMVVEKAFYTFLNNAYVYSKDHGRICVGDCVYRAQRKAITAIFDALEEDVHHVYILKSRQLGISTIIRLLTTFLIGLNPGLKGAIVFDEDKNKIQARNELEVVIQELPGKLKFPTVKRNNRHSLVLANEAEIVFLAAGVTKKRAGGGLGRSLGLSFVHASELCSWVDPAGVEALRNSLSELNPNRLYIWESTARGFNIWYDMWVEAKNDPLHCKCVFLGWYDKDTQTIERSHRDYATYGAHPPDEKEKKKIDEVKRRYGEIITQEQLAWIRRKYDPTARADDSEKSKAEADGARIQEQPWTEDEAFQTTGSIFFSAEKLTDQSAKWVDTPKWAYAFLAGEEFVNMRAVQSESSSSVELKVWEEPEEDAFYALGIDPAFGENPANDRSSIQVLRCYADGCDQVAEYAFSMINTRQLAWVIAALCGWYGQHPRNEIRYLLELNGPGVAVWNELRALRQQIDTGYPPLAAEEGLKNIFRNVQAFLRSREDSLGPSVNWHIKTTPQSKVADLETLRDYVSNGQFHIRSRALLDEMRTITREESKLGAPAGKKDDRVLAAAFAIRCWTQKLRPNLVARKLTREAVLAKKQLVISDQVFLFNQNTLNDYFRDKKIARLQAVSQARRSLWRR